MKNARVLIAGCGKAGIVAAVGVSQRGEPHSVTVWSRPSARGKALGEELSRNGMRLEATAEHSDDPFVSGTARIAAFVTDISELQDKFDVVLLATPTTEFMRVLGALVEKDRLSSTPTIIALSSRPGTGAELSTYLDARLESHELLVLGAYYGVTFSSPDRLSSARTVAVKSEVPIWRWSKGTGPLHTNAYLSLMRRSGIRIDEYDNPLDNERRNSNIFHLSLALMPRVLERIFDPEHRSFHYRYWPEGNWHPEAIESTIRLEDELNILFMRLGLPPFNFLKFRIARYPIPDGIISEDRIEGSLELPFIERAYLYMNYLWARQVDPWGERNPITCEYPDHIRATFLPRVTVANGIGEIPRIPAEDLETLAMYLALAERLDERRSEMETLRDNFLRGLDTLPQRFGYRVEYSWGNVSALGWRLAERILEFVEQRKPA